MSKKSKGQKFVDEFDAGDNEDIYEILKEAQGDSSRKSVVKLTISRGIKMEWQDEDN